MSRTRLQIASTTWNRDSNGLFDYDSRTLFHQSFRSAVAAQVVRTGNHCLLSRMDSTSNGEILVTVAVHAGERYIVQESKGGSRLWIVVKSLKGRIPGAELSQGDVIRLGKLAMTVKRTSDSIESSPILPKKHTFGKQDTSENLETHSLNEPGQCRICLGETFTPENPFIAPCACDGSMKFIHLQCLREWLKSKMTIRESGAVITYSWQSLACELCKSALPETIRCGSGFVELLDFHRPQIAYIVLEDSNQGQVDSEKLIYVVSLTEGDSVRIVTASLGARPRQRNPPKRYIRQSPPRHYQAARRRFLSRRPYFQVRHSDPSPLRSHNHPQFPMRCASRPHCPRLLCSAGCRVSLQVLSLLLPKISCCGPGESGGYFH